MESQSFLKFISLHPEKSPKTLSLPGICCGKTFSIGPWLLKLCSFKKHHLSHGCEEGVCSYLTHRKCWFRKTSQEQDREKREMCKTPDMPQNHTPDLSPDLQLPMCSFFLSFFFLKRGVFPPNNIALTSKWAEEDRWEMKKRKILFLINRLVNKELAQSRWNLGLW